MPDSHGDTTQSPASNKCTEVRVNFQETSQDPELASGGEGLGARMPGSNLHSSMKCCVTWGKSWPRSLPSVSSPETGKKDTSLIGSWLVLAGMIYVPGKLLAMNE